MVIVTPRVYHSVATCWEIVHIRSENKFAITIEFRISYTIIIIYGVHVVVGSHAKAHLSPCLEISFVEGKDT